MDPRKGLPSASAMERLTLCPGSHALQAKVPDAEAPAASSYAETGTRVAKLVERYFGKKIEVDSPTPAEEDMAKTLQEQSRMVYDRAARLMKERLPASDISLKPPAEQCSTEIRIWGKTPAGNEFSGQYDLAIVNDAVGFAVIIDHKTGWRKVQPADQNRQLRALAVLLNQATGIKTIFVGVVQPNLGHPSVAVYEGPILEAAKAETFEVVDAVRPDAPRHPHPDACRYCRAKHICPEATGLVMNFATGKLPEDWTSVLDQLEIVEQISNDLRARAKALLTQTPDAIPGWKLKPGAQRRSIAEAGAAYMKIKDVVSAPEFLECCTVKVGALTTIYAVKGKIKRPEAAKALASRLGDSLIVKETSPSLVRDGGEEETTDEA